MARQEGTGGVVAAGACDCAGACGALVGTCSDGKIGAEDGSGSSTEPDRNRAERRNAGARIAAASTSGCDCGDGERDARCRVARRRSRPTRRPRRRAARAAARAEGYKVMPVKRPCTKRLDQASKDMSTATSNVHQNNNMT